MGAAGWSYEPYRDEDPTRFRWRLGLRPLSLDAWLQFDADADADLALKGELLREHHDTVFATHSDPTMQPSVDAASDEVYELVTEWIRENAPERRIEVADPSQHRLEAAARLVQEDLVLLVPAGETLVLGAGCVCFPNKWDLRSKMGRTMEAIHQPVPRLNDELAAPIDSFLDRLRPERPFWRLGWTVVPSDDLYLAVDGTAVARRADDPARFVLRVERETLRRLPRSGAVLFTIRTHRTPLGDIRADSADALATALQALPPDVHEYKALTAVGAEAAEFLQRATA